MRDARDPRKTIKRYNAGIQRARGLLELASGLYDSSLATESWKAAEGVLQTDTPIASENILDRICLEIADEQSLGEARSNPSPKVMSPSFGSPLQGIRRLLLPSLTYSAQLDFRVGRF